MIIPFRRTASFETAAAQEEKGVYLTCLGMLGNREDASDALQETMLRAFRAWNTFRGEASAKTWMHRIAVNVCLDMLRARKAEASLDALREDGFEPSGEAESVYLALERSERERLLQEAIVALPEDQRSLVVLRDLRGLSYEEIAGALSLPLGTVKSRLNRAREKLTMLLLKNAELFQQSFVSKSERRRQG